MTHIFEFPFHIGDFLTGTIQMDATEVGAYTMLIIAHYQAGEDGLPDDDEILARIAKVTPHIWKRLRPVLLKKFEISNGFWLHEKVVESVKNIQKISSENSANSLKRWNAPHANAYANHQPLNQDDKNPLTPMLDLGDKTANGFGAVVIHGKIFDVSEYLTDVEWRAMTVMRPKWDRHALIRRYNAWIATRGECPRSPRAAFVGWLKTQPEEPC